MHRRPQPSGLLAVDQAIQRVSIELSRLTAIFVPLQTFRNYALPPINLGTVLRLEIVAVHPTNFPRPIAAVAETVIALDDKAPGPIDELAESMDAVYEYRMDAEYTPADEYTLRIGVPPPRSR